MTPSLKVTAILHDVRAVSLRAEGKCVHRGTQTSKRSVLVFLEEVGSYSLDLSLLQPVHINVDAICFRKLLTSGASEQSSHSPSFSAPLLPNSIVGTLFEVEGRGGVTVIGLVVWLEVERFALLRVSGEG